METSQGAILKKLLGSSEFISGQKLASELTISRAAISKAVKELISQGFEIEAISNRGYKLISYENVISSPLIEGLLLEKGVELEAFHFKSIGSTNSWAKEHVERFKELTLVVSEEQTAGRGRFNRAFYSPQGSGIYMSLVIKNRMMVENVQITCAAAVAVRRALVNLFAVECGIKWVNDIYLNSKKVCGILTEGTLDMESGSLSSVVVGIGINLTTDSFPSEVSEIAGAVANGKKVNRARVVCEVISELIHILKSESVESFMTEYRKHSLILGKMVRVKKGCEEFAGKAVDIDMQGELTILKSDGGLEHFNSGEVSVKL